MGRHIRGYAIGKRTMDTRLAWGDYYSMESEWCPSIVYIIRPNEIGIVDSDIGIRLSMDMVADLCKVYKEAQDLIKRRIIT